LTFRSVGTGVPTNLSARTHASMRRSTRFTGHSTQSALHRRTPSQPGP
jgi:hypothetical protein